jgi:pimeloyl-ACP methyl ester carboxylesterase
MITKYSALLLLLLAAPATAAPHPSRTKLQPCKVPGQGGEAEAFCGTYEVWENRAAKSGRKIGLKVVLIPALSANPKPDPIFYFAGGPGQAASPLAGNLAGDSLLEDRDAVFIDQRGTGGPGRLFCSLGGHDGDLQSYFVEMFPLDAIRECREELEKKADLTLYTTDLAIDDFDEIRAWLGYGKINLLGGSYGTRAAQVYMKRHPKSVRAAVIAGVAPMDEPLSLSHAANGQRSLDLLLGWCEKDDACHAKFPAIRADFQAVMGRLGQGPVTVEVDHPHTHKRARVTLSRDFIAEGIRWALYGDSEALPLRIHQAAGGDLAPLAQASVNSRLGAIDGITSGLLFSVTCAEDMPYIDPAEVSARTAGSFLGDYRVRQQLAACSVWPRGQAAPGHREALRTNIPILLVSGERDPVTPPAFADRAARFLTRGTKIVVPWGSHGGDDPCTLKIQRDFLRKGSAQGLDTSCLSRIKMPPFVLE